MGFFDEIKEKAVGDAKTGKKYREKDPWEMSEKELDRELMGSKSIAGKKKYAEEKTRRK